LFCWIYLTAAFDTVDHGILLHRLDSSYQIVGSVQQWFQSYLSNRLQHVRVGSSSLSPGSMVCGVPQGSALGNILFLLYCGDLQLIIESHGLCLHLYADDSQIYYSCRPSVYLELQSRISTYIEHVAEWMRKNRLQLNAVKTEILWLVTSRRLHQMPQAPLRVGTDFVTSSAVIRDIGIHLDSDMSMSSHVRKTVSTYFAVLRQLRYIRRSVSRPVVQSLVTSLVLSRLDNGNTGRYSSTTFLASSVSDECSCSTNLLIVEV